jgi:CheY-like chemotaxis protein
MSLPFRVYLQGFSPFERSALASYFRLAANRSPAYEQVQTETDAHFLIVDADQTDAVRAALVAGRVRDAVFIGAQPPEGACAWMMRPIDPLHVLRELDAMASTRATQRSLLRGLTARSGEHPGQATVIRPAPPGRPSARRAGDEAGGIVPVRRPPVARPDAPRGRDALLVDDSEIALRFLETRLSRFGLRTERARTSVQAVESLSRRAFDFVFLDVELGEGSELDGLALCRHVKQQHRHLGGQAQPVVVMISAHYSELDRVRGTLAGADAYLGKPLDEQALAQLLALHGIAPPAASESADFL